MDNQLVGLGELFLNMLGLLLGLESASDVFEVVDTAVLLKPVASWSNWSYLFFKDWQHLRQGVLGLLFTFLELVSLSLKSVVVALNLLLALIRYVIRDHL